MARTVEFEVSAGAAVRRLGGAHGRVMVVVHMDRERKRIKGVDSRHRRRAADPRALRARARRRGRAVDRHGIARLDQRGPAAPTATAIATSAAPARDSRARNLDPMSRHRPRTRGCVLSLGAVTRNAEPSRADESSSPVGSLSSRVRRRQVRVGWWPRGLSRRCQPQNREPTPQDESSSRLGSASAAFANEDQASSASLAGQPGADRMSSDGAVGAGRRARGNGQGERSVGVGRRREETGRESLNPPTPPSSPPSPASGGG